MDFLFVSQSNIGNVTNNQLHLYAIGMYEPTDTECEWPSDDEEDDEDLAGEVKDKIKLSDGEKKDEEKKTDEDTDPPAKGVPEFWLTIFKNVDMLQEMVQEHDEPVLAKLADVKVTFSDGSTQPMVRVLFNQNIRGSPL